MHVASPSAAAEPKPLVPALRPPAWPMLCSWSVAALFQNVPPPALETAGDDRRRRFLREALVLAIVLMALVASVWSSWGGERRAVARLDPATRAAVLARTLEDLRSVCLRPDAAHPATWCRQQAEFALAFEECDTACRASAREVLRVPTR